MKQIHLFTNEIEEIFEFVVELYVEGKGNFRKVVTIDKNDKRTAIHTAKNLLRIKYFQQAKVFRLN